MVCFGCVYYFNFAFLPFGVALLFPIAVDCKSKWDYLFLPTLYKVLKLPLLFFSDFFKVVNKLSEALRWFAIYVEAVPWVSLYFAVAHALFSNKLPK